MQTYIHKAPSDPKPSVIFLKHMPQKGEVLQWKDPGGAEWHAIEVEEVRRMIYTDFIPTVEQWVVTGRPVHTTEPT